MRTRLIAAIAALTGAGILLVNAGVGGGQSAFWTTPGTETGAAYVTITFDDAYVSQYDAAAMLDERGMRGVFFVPAGQLNGSFEGIPTMTGEQVQDLQRRGHEIGGHTYNHSDMDAMTASAVGTAIQENRDALSALGVRPVAFAYPYGNGVTHRDTVMDTYDYARAVSWDVNRWPPQEPGALSTLALTEDNHDDLDTYMAQLEPGDWLVISLHHIDNGSVGRERVDVHRDTYETILDQVQQADVTVTTFSDMEAQE